MATLIEASKIIRDIVRDNWNRTIVEPAMIIKEEYEALRYNLPEEGVIVFGEASSGHRFKPRGNWKYYDELVVVECRVETMESYERFFEILNELARIIVNYHTEVKPSFCRAKLLSYAPISEETFQWWKGVLRVEVERVGAYIISGT
jgi:hypothetical protein